MADIFISFAREDLERVRLLAGAIEGAGYSVFWDQKTPAGMTRQQHIGKALDDARCVVVVWSALSTESYGVIAEADYGRRRGILIPVVIEDVTSPPAFQSLPHEDLAAWDGDPYHPRINRFLASIKKITGTPLPIEQDSLPKENETAPAPAEKVSPNQPAKNGQPGQARKPAFFLKPGAVLAALAFIFALSLPFFMEGLGDRERQISRGPVADPPSAVSAAKSSAEASRDENPEKESGAAAIDGPHAKPGGHAGKAAGDISVSFANQIGMQFVLVPAGDFMMGSDESTYAKPMHQVVIRKPFYMQTTEVTQGQWREIMGANPSAFKDCGSSCPVENVSWNGVQTFIRKLNALTGEQYRLPAEAEWEYAARSGGRDQTYAGGENLDDFGWYSENSGGRTHPAGQKMPNGLGLYDMSGNVWEWVADDWHGYHKGPPDDGRAWVDSPRGAYRVIRGGGWDDAAWHCRSAARYSFPPRVRHDHLGFRLARSVTLGP